MNKALNTYLFIFIYLFIHLLVIPYFLTDTLRAKKTWLHSEDNIFQMQFLEKKIIVHVFGFEFYHFFFPVGQMEIKSLLVKVAGAKLLPEPMMTQSYRVNDIIRS